MLMATNSRQCHLQTTVCVTRRGSSVSRIHECTS